MIAKYKGGPRDTLYKILSGAEMVRLITDLRAYELELEGWKGDSTRDAGP